MQQASADWASELEPPLHLDNLCLFLWNVDSTQIHGIWQIYGNSYPFAGIKRNFEASFDLQSSLNTAYTQYLSNAADNGTQRKRARLWLLLGSSAAVVLWMQSAWLAEQRIHNRPILNQTIERNP